MSSSHLNDEFTSIGYQRDATSGHQVLQHVWSFLTSIDIVPLTPPITTPTNFHINRKLTGAYTIFAPLCQTIGTGAFQTGSLGSTVDFPHTMIWNSDEASPVIPAGDIFPTNN